MRENEGKGNVCTMWDKYFDTSKVTEVDDIRHRLPRTENATLQYPGNCSSVSKVSMLSRIGQERAVHIAGPDLPIVAQIDETFQPFLDGTGNFVAQTGVVDDKAVHRVAGLEAQLPDRKSVV